MIYIKNYQALNGFTDSPNLPSSSLSQLHRLIGKTITVFTDSGGVSGRGFTGVLCEVFPDSLRLLTALPQNRTCRRHGVVRHCQKSGASTILFFNHITAFTYNYM